MARSKGGWGLAARALTCFTTATPSLADDFAGVIALKLRVYTWGQNDVYIGVCGGQETLETSSYLVSRSGSSKTQKRAKHFGAPLSGVGYLNQGDVIKMHVDMPRKTLKYTVSDFKGTASSIDLKLPKDCGSLSVFVCTACLDTDAYERHPVTVALLQQS